MSILPKENRHPLANCQIQALLKANWKGSIVSNVFFFKAVILKRWLENIVREARVAFLPPGFLEDERDFHPDPLTSPNFCADPGGTGNEMPGRLSRVLIHKVRCTGPGATLLLEVRDSPFGGNRSHTQKEKICFLPCERLPHTGVLLRQLGSCFGPVTLVSFISDWFLITHVNAVCSRPQF